MSLKDLLDLSEKLEDRINTYWNFYTLVVLAVVGWRFSNPVAFNPINSVIAVIVLGAFFYSNFSVIRICH